MLHEVDEVVVVFGDSPPISYAQDHGTGVPGHIEGG